MSLATKKRGPLSKAIVEEESDAEETNESSPPKKQQKQDRNDTKDENDEAEETAEKSIVQKNDQGEAYVELSKKRRITIRSWRNQTFIDIREYYQDDAGTSKPGKKGISLNKEQWEALKSLVSTIDDEGASVASTPSTRIELTREEDKVDHRKMKILVTGFEPFANYSINPSELVAKAVDGLEETASSTETGRSITMQYTGMVLTVDDAGARHVADELDARRQQQPWSMILHLGLFSGAKGIRLELCGANRCARTRYADRPDKPSAPTPDDVLIAPRAPEILPTTLPMSHLCLPVEDQEEDPPRPDLTWSRDAGTYYCNEIYFRTLYAVRKHRITAPSTPISPVHPTEEALPRSPITRAEVPLLPVVFVHLPDLDVATVEEGVSAIQELVRHVLVK